MSQKPENPSNKNIVVDTSANELSGSIYAGNSGIRMNLSGMRIYTNTMKEVVGNIYPGPNHEGQTMPDMHGADLRNADCRNTHWERKSPRSPIHRAMIEGADFTGATGLGFQDFIEAYPDQRTVFPEGITQYDVLAVNGTRRFKHEIPEPPLTRLQIENHQTAYNFASQSVDHIASMVKPGMTEKDIVGISMGIWPDMDVRRKWCGDSFSALVGERTSWKNPTWDYSPSNDEPVRDDDIFVISATREFNNTIGYAIRTYEMRDGVVVDGRTDGNTRLKDIFNVHQGIKSLVAEQAEPNMQSADLWDMVSRYIKDTGYAVHRRYPNEHHGVSLDRESGKRLGDYRYFQVPTALMTPDIPKRAFHHTDGYGFTGSVAKPRLLIFS